MQVITSLGLLERIVSYQDGDTSRNMLIQPDIACSCGHLNLLRLQKSFHPTSHAYIDIINKHPSINLIEYLLEAGLDASFIIGDNACKMGNSSIVNFVFGQTKFSSQFSFKSLVNCAIGDNVDICKQLQRNFKLFALPSGVMVNAALHHKDNVIKWIHNSIMHPNDNQSIPREFFHSILEQQHIALIYFIKKSSKFHYSPEITELLISNPWLLIQARSTKAVDACASVGNLSLLHLLFVYQGKESHVALDSAASNGYFDIVRYLTGIKE